VGDGTQYPPSPLPFDPSLILEDHSVKEIAEGPMDIPGQRQMAGDGCRSQRSQILKKPPNHCLKVECLLQMGSHFFCQLIACFGNHMTLEDLNFPFFQQVFMTISH